MRKLFEKIVAHLTEWGIGYAMSAVSLAVTWILYSPLSPWAGWRAFAIGILCGAMVLLIWVTYRDVQSGALRERRQHRARKEELRSALAHLDAKESRILARFRESNTLGLPIMEPSVAGLIGKGILVRASNAGEIEKFPTMLAPMVREAMRARDTTESPR